MSFTCTVGLISLFTILITLIVVYSSHLRELRFKNRLLEGNYNALLEKHRYLVQEVLAKHK